MAKYAIRKDLKKGSHFHPTYFKWTTLLTNSFIKKFPKFIDKSKVDFQVIKLDYTKIYVITPKELVDKMTPCLFYIHGGGFMLCAISLYFHYAQMMAIKSNCRLILVEYRTTPKFTYPTPIEDCFEGYQYVIQHQDELKIDIQRIMMGGDSSGGSLCLDTYRYLFKASLPLPIGFLLLYPVVDDAQNTPSMMKYQDTPVWNAKCNKKMWEWYLNEKKYDSPLAHLEEYQIKHLFVEIEEFDCLHDEGLALYNGLKEKVPNHILVDNLGTYHGYDFNTKSPFVIQSYEEKTAFLKSAFFEKK